MISMMGVPYRWGWRVTGRLLQGEDPLHPWEASQTATRYTSAPTVPTPLMLSQIWGTTCVPTQERSPSLVSFALFAPRKRGISLRTSEPTLEKNHTPVPIVPTGQPGRAILMPTYWHIAMLMNRELAPEMMPLDHKEIMVDRKSINWSKIVQFFLVAFPNCCIICKKCYQYLFVKKTVPQSTEVT